MSQQQPQPQQQPEHQPQQAEHASARPSESITLAVQRMWEVVRKGADVIVTLRQENAMLQNQMAQLRLAESDLQSRVQEFTDRLANLEADPNSAVSAVTAASAVTGLPMTDRDPGLQIDRLEDKIQALQNELNEAHSRLAEQSDLSQQLMQMRLELEARTHLLQELQDSYPDREDEQLALFNTSAGGLVLTATEVRAIADRLDSVAGQLDELARLS